MKAYFDIYEQSPVHSIFHSHKRRERSGSSFRVSRIPPFDEERRP